MDTSHTLGSSNASDTYFETAQESPFFVGQQDVEVDSDATRSDIDSALGDSDTSTFSETLGSSIYNPRYENGRRYHAFKDGAYLNPDDEVEQERLNHLHHLWRMMLDGRLYIAPISKDPQHVLDIGTGTGSWAIEFADEHPSAKVIGTDLSPIQPTWIPPNCFFYVDDASSEWLFNDSFDFIHGRALCGCIADWPMFFREVRRNLRPGGWVEMQDYVSAITSDDDTINRSEWTVEWSKNINRGSEMFGKSMDVVHKYAQWLQQAGFVDTREEIIKVPIGAWARDPKLKEMGVVALTQMLESVESFTLALFTRVLGYSIEQTQVIMAGVKSEFLDKRNHWYITYHFVVGRKPER